MCKRADVASHFMLFLLQRVLLVRRPRAALDYIGNTIESELQHPPYHASMRRVV